MIDGLGQPHEYHLLFGFNASLGVSFALIDQFIQFFIFCISVTSIDQGAAEGTVGVDLAVEVVPRHLTRLAVHLLRLADLAS